MQKAGRACNECARQWGEPTSPRGPGTRGACVRASALNNRSYMLAMVGYRSDQVSESISWWKWWSKWRQIPDTGSPDPRSSGRSWLPSLSGTLIACPTCFLHYKLLAPTILGQPQLPTPSLPSILEGNGPVICFIQLRFWGGCPPDSTR